MGSIFDGLTEDGKEALLDTLSRIAREGADNKDVQSLIGKFNSTKNKKSRERILEKIFNELDEHFIKSLRTK